MEHRQTLENGKMKQIWTFESDQMENMKQKISFEEKEENPLMKFK